MSLLLDHMKYLKRLVLTVFVLFQGPHLFSQSTTQDSISMFYDSLFHQLETHYLHSNKVDWASLKPATIQAALRHSTFEASLSQSVQLFNKIEGDHLNLFSEHGWYKSTLKPEMKQEDFHIELLKKYVANPSLEGRVIKDHYAYVLIPAMPLINATQEEIDKNSQAIYDLTDSLSQNNHIKGWIIDLRVNTGGNANTMLMGLYKLLGNNKTYTALNAQRKLVEVNVLKDGYFWQNKVIKTKINYSESLTPNIPVALLISKMTTSADEFVALGFRGRVNTIFIGEESYGLTTSNDLFQLPFHSKIAITISYGADRNGRNTPSIVPNTIIPLEANYTELEKDKNLIKAMEFIDSIH